MQTPPFGIRGGVECGGGIWFWGWERFAGWKERAEVKPEILYIPARLNRFRNDGPKHGGNRA